MISARMNSDLQEVKMEESGKRRNGKDKGRNEPGAQPRHEMTESEIQASTVGKVAPLAQPIFISDL